MTTAFDPRDASHRIIYWYQGRWGANFVFDEPVSEELRSGCASAFLNNPARVIEAANAAMRFTATDTPVNRQLIKQYRRWLAHRARPQDRVHIEADLARYADLLAERVGRLLTRCEVAEAILAMLREIKDVVLTRESAR